MKPARPKRLTYDIIGAAIQVHRTLGPDHPERVYHLALHQALLRAGLDVISQPRVSLTDRHGTLLALYRPDLLVRRDGDAVLVELKAEPRLDETHRRQVRAYLSAWRGHTVGLLINFGAPRLEWEKVFRPRRNGRRRRWRER